MLEQGIAADKGLVDDVSCTTDIQRDIAGSTVSDECEACTGETLGSIEEDSDDYDSEDEEYLDPYQLALKSLKDIINIVPSDQEFPGRQEFENKLKMCQFSVGFAYFAASARFRWAERLCREQEERSYVLAELLREEKAGEIFRTKRLTGYGIIEYCESVTFLRTESYNTALEQELGEVTRHRKWTLAMECIDNLKAVMLEDGLVDLDVPDLAVRVFKLLKDVPPKWENHENDFKTRVPIDFTVLDDRQITFIKALCSFLDIDWSDDRWLAEWI